MKPRRATLTKAEFNPDKEKPEVMYSISLSKLRFYQALIGTATAIVVGIAGAASVLDSRIESAIDAHEMRAEARYRKDLAKIELKLARVELLLDEVYESTTGRKPPTLSK